MSELRKCVACKETKPLTLEHWHVAPECIGGLHHSCRECRNYNNAARARAAKRARIEAELAGDFRHHSEKDSGKICGLCAGLAHRVMGAACPRCGLAFEAEARPEFVLRKAVG